MKNIIRSKVFLLAGIILFVSACTSEFDEMNTSPNSATVVPGTSVLGASMLTSMYTLFGTRLDCYYAGAYSGYISAADYEYRVDINNSMWKSMYTTMTYSTDAMSLALEEENDNLYAAALTFRAYNAHKTCDMWGDIPYSEAFQLEDGVIYPVYDSQEKVYNTILDELKTAADMFDTEGDDIGDGDFLFEGDIQKWKKFCNSLRLRVAIRMSSADESAAAAVIQDVLGDATKYPIMTENEDNAYWYFPGVAPDEEIWYESMGTVGDAAKTSGWRMQQPIIDALQDNNDPRLPVYADKNAYGVYSGHRFGPNDKSDTLNNSFNRSHIGDWFMNDPQGFVPYMNCAEVYFCLAEAYERGLATGDAQTAYETGIKKSCEESGQITSAAISTFLTEPEVAWDEGNTSNLEKVALQKWICLFKQSVEGWSEARRTDIPLLTGVASDYAASHNRPPFRMAYADEEKSLNSNFPFDIEEVDIFYGTQLWWDKRTGVE
ncbi:SusD/RagB family nutrient-binding outer membrane lipoprotein [Maribellus comscasis]|uniref:SusD/RagB family nutrient-binding outer membrane lipoprotein n=1 Tax=Maribellus comscasis TaxID=2681766 RepID=A0A6I6K325_9BACT|nr:SusD/RagB family nutrient-binding outer membrane lipoprotein [Maribellus comscasis]QGY46792.1 SusD/RagB family nutrient-binding outer membrane lipoprotein [Maribellus comscasis]